MQKKNKSLFGKFLKWVALLAIASVLFTVLLVMLVYAGIFGTLPGKTELSAISIEEASIVYSADKAIIGEFFAQNRTNITLKDVPDHLKNALIATEDKRFFTHKGYDLQSYLRVFFKNILFRNSSGGGGSTLTQQLAKNWYGRNRYGLLTMPVNKIKEIIIASRIEKIYSKEEILLLYLNSVPFGDNVYGVEAAAHRYFNKHTRELKVEESAVLVGLLKANTYFNPRLNPANSLARRNMVLTLMSQENYLTEEAADSLKKLPLNLHYANLVLNVPAGYFVFQVKKQTLEILKGMKNSSGEEYDLEKDGLKIYTTLNMQMQEMAQEAIKNQLRSMQPLLDRELTGHNFKKQWYAAQRNTFSNDDQAMQKREVDLFDWDGVQTRNITRLDSLWHYTKMLNGAVLITNPKTGEVLSWVGGNDFRMMPFDMILSHRQIASAFKPFLYATALENGYSPCSYLENSEKTYEGYEDWEPKNYNSASTPNSTVAFWYALANSMNLPTVDLYFKVGRDKLLNTLNRLDFPKPVNNAPSIALGTLDLSLSEVVRAYGAFANGGQMNKLVMINKITDSKGKILYQREASQPEQVFDPETSEKITAILQEAINHGTGAGIRGRYGISAELAGKTGTAQNYTDAWFFAYTPDLVLGTWVGASKPDVHFYSGMGAGASLALPVIGNVLGQIERDNSLRNRYLTPFLFSDETASVIDCPPYRENGVSGFFNRLFNITPKDEPPANQRSDKKEDKRSFFDRLFNRKK